jgi:hypothetical protein
MPLHIGAVGKSTKFVYLLMLRSRWRRSSQKRRLLWITEKEAKLTWLPPHWRCYPQLSPRFFLDQHMTNGLKDLVAANIRRRAVSVDNLFNSD